MSKIVFRGKTSDNIPINPTAKELYKTFGFVEYGSLPKGLLYKGKFEDEVYMYYEVKP